MKFQIGDMVKRAGDKFGRKYFEGVVIEVAPYNWYGVKIPGSKLSMEWYYCDQLHLIDMIKTT